MLLSLSTGLVVGIIFLVIVVLIVVMVINVYNQLVILRNNVKNSWSQIDVQLKRRYDMIPNLVETVKGYASHEDGIFKEFAKARSMYQEAAKTGSVSGAAEAEKGISGAIGRLLMVQEQYPELKANENFKELMVQLKDTEDKVSFGRQFYNDTALKLNNKIELFPSNIIANMFHFKAADFFNVDSEEERKGIKVKF